MHAFTRRRSRVVAAVATLMFTAAVAAVPSAQAAAPAVPPAVVPRAETAALFDDDQGGNANADDPAIWRNSADPDASLVIATANRFNNVDLVHRTSSVPGATDLAVVSDRGSDKLPIYRVAGDRPDAPLIDVTDASAPWIFSGSQEEVNEERTAYGLATYTDSATGRSYALVSQNATTRIALLELITTRDGKVSYRKIRTLDLPAAFTMPDGTKWSPCGEPGEGPQVEGMVVDPETGVLFAGQEDVGVWRLRADLKGAPVLQDKVREYGVPATYDEASDECVAGDDPGFGGVRVSADVEGLTLMKQDDGDGYLLASSQGDDTFVAYDRERSDEYEYEGGFRVSAASESLDGSEECDGADVLAEPLGGRYPNGLLVVQDGHMAPEDGGREATGFKFVDLADVLEALDD
ncbi:phytase [Streptomyces coelicoflavus]|uniref:phytase n=1 Tax=Streptomyces coelicoflavus TaxID=285562 RepID=UPI003F4A5F65